MLFREQSALSSLFPVRNEIWRGQVSVQCLFVENEAGNFLLPLYDAGHGVAPSDTARRALIRQATGYRGG